jgi:hypothetical protein
MMMMMMNIIILVGWVCVWIVATNGHIVHPQGDIWAWRTMVE